MRLISIDIQKKDYLAAGLDTIGLLVPAGTGFGELSKPVQEGVVWLSKKLGKSVDEVLKMVGKGAGTTKRIFNITRQESKIWKGFDNVKGMARKSSGSGNNKRYYEWDNTHNDIEVYDSKGKHLGSLNPTTGKIYKGPVKGRAIKL